MKLPDTGTSTKRVAASIPEWYNTIRSKRYAGHADPGRDHLAELSSPTTDRTLGGGALTLALSWQTRERTVIRFAPIGLVASLYALVAAAHSATLPSVCSLIVVAAGRDTATTYFVGRALPDTVRTGAGAVRVKSSMAGGHWGPPTERTIFGQVVLVEQLGGKGVTAIESAFARGGSREVIVVPWDYDPACQPVTWAGSARWVTATRPGFYRVRLRPESLWVAGRPVLDAVHADIEPYPHGVLFQHGYRGTDALRRGPSLTAGEYFELYSALPDWDRATREPAAALAELDAWERANSTTARTYPAPEILTHVRRMLRPR